VKILVQIRHQVAIAGIVSDSETQLPLHKARVQIVGVETPNPFLSKLELKSLQYGVNWENLLERPDLTHTRIDGRFHFLDLPEGKYKLEVSVPDAGTRYGKQTKEVEIKRENQGQIGMIVADVLLPPTTINGCIKEKGNPVVMAKVQIKGCNEYTFSDKNGKYKLTCLEATKNKHTVQVFARDYQDATLDVVLNQGETKTLDFNLSK
jgi:Carboxypeptidase regulatory-like domain